MAQQGQTVLPMTQATSAPQGGGPKAANPAAVNPLVAPQQQSARPGEVDPRDGAVQEVAQEMQKKQAPAPQPAPVMAQPQIGGLAAPAQPMAPPMMAKGGMKDDAPEGLAVMIGLGAPTPSYEEAAEGNPPPGATKEEVADDQLVLLSEGELVVPANVVRYHGLGAYEGMRREALMGLQEMENSGQIEYVSGGKEKADPIDDDGGLVKAQAGTTLMGSGLPGRLPSNPNEEVQLIDPIFTVPEAASSRFVTTPRQQRGIASPTTDTTPLNTRATLPAGARIDPVTGRIIYPSQLTPTTQGAGITSIVAPNVGQYTQSQDPDPAPDSDPDPAPDPAPQPQAQQARPTVEKDERDPDPFNVGGGRAVLGDTVYGLGYQSSDATAGFKGALGGITAGLLGKNDQVVFTDLDTGRTATMSRARYDQMKENRNDPNNTAYINNLMDIQEGLNLDYRNQKGFAGRGSGFLDKIISPGARNFDQNNAAKALAQDMGMEYTGQSLAEMVVESNQRSAPPLSSSGGVDPASQTVPGDAQLSSLGAPSVGFDPARDAMFAGETGSVNFGQDTSDAAFQDIPFARTAAEADSVNIDYIKDNIRLADSIENQLAFLDAVIATGGAKDVDAGGFNRPATGNAAQNASFARAAANVRSQILEARRTADGSNYEAEAYGSISSQTDEAFGRPTDYESDAAETTRRAEAQRREDAQLYRPGTRYRAPEDRTFEENKEIADAEAKQQMRDKGRDEDTVRRTSAVTDSRGNPVRQGGSGKDAGSVVTNTEPKEEKGSGKIVCTEMYRQTQLEDWARTMKIWDTYQKRYLTPIHEVGYHWLFKPYVRGMQNSGILTNIGAFFAQKRTQHLKHVLTKGRAKDSFVGNVWCKIIHPIVYLIGKMVYKK